jgi:hypothetical protein
VPRGRGKRQLVRGQLAHQTLPESKVNQVVTVLKLLGGLNEVRSLGEVLICRSTMPDPKQTVLQCCPVPTLHLCKAGKTPSLVFPGSERWVAGEGGVFGIL